MVDNLATKLGVAVEQLQPVAETMIHEIQFKGVAGAVTASIACIACIFFARFGYRLCSKNKWDILEDEVMPGIMAMTLFGIGAIISFSIGCDLLMEACAPTVTLLQSIK